MGCVWIVLALLVPRVAIVLAFLFTRWLEAAFDTWVWPVLGLLFMPYTTLAYTAAAVSTGHRITGGWIVLIVIAVLVDVAHWGGGVHRRRSIVVRRRR